MVGLGGMCWLSVEVILVIGQLVHSTGRYRELHGYSYAQVYVVLHAAVQPHECYQHAVFGVRRIAYGRFTS